MASTDEVVEAIDSLEVRVPATGISFEAAIDQCLRASSPLLQLLASGVWHDQDAVHERLWLDVLQRLVDAGTNRLQSANSVLEKVRRYPALLAFMTMGMSTVTRGREGLLIRMGLDVAGHPDMGLGEPSPAADLLHSLRVLHPDAVNQQPRWGETRWLYPSSHQLKSDLRTVLEDLIPEPHYEVAFHGVEYRIGLLQRTLGGSAYKPQLGEYIGEGQWPFGREGSGEVLRAEALFRQSKDLQPWFDEWGSSAETDVEEILTDHRDYLTKGRRWT